MSVTFTLDLEDHCRQPNPRPRYGVITEKVLDFLEQRTLTPLANPEFSSQARSKPLVAICNT